MSKRPALASSCPHCHGRGWFGAWLGGRELLLGAAALGLVVGLGWASEGKVCEQLADELADEREAALRDYFERRCEPGQCESIELVSTTGCRAKVRVVERRFDDYGDEIGLFRSDEGLEFSPVLERWRKGEVLDEKQLLGLPAH
jgi:hypothetical protein